jgi:tripartite-type tricarboxylate transporter receptor subunit TctC
VHPCFCRYGTLSKVERPIVEKLAAEVKHVFEEPSVVTALTKVGGEPAPMSPDKFAAFIAAERPKWQQVVKAAGVHIDEK